ncbi:FG-GAP-like repeat-containing protein [Paraglaciecola arctica]|uniref:FG-GAP-like repeat-containing protein n=1 Tax=Paraglaciecola arctica TaxID=1128911 RepID=UPI001C066FA4|nr:FG-GAP-like repeat-containing protein [Paraglaciecola arctica]MBU3004227.1 thrombospondin type 3 repeat-containing protein [Paraglaciecola arctica]
MKIITMLKMANLVIKRLKLTNYKLQIVFLFALLFSSSSQAIEFLEIKASIGNSNSEVYLIPIKPISDDRMVTVAEFYAKDEATGNTVTDLDVESKTELLMISNAIYWLKYESEYNLVREQAGTFIKYMQGQAYDSSKIVSLEDLAGSVAAVTASAGVGCAIGAVGGTTVAPFTAGASIAAGCFGVATVLGAVATIDEAVSYLIKATNNLISTSQPEDIVINEGFATQQIISSVSSRMVTLMRFIVTDKSAVANIALVEDIWNLYLEIRIAFSVYDNICKQFLPDRYLEAQDNMSLSFTAVSVVTNVATSASTPIPASSMAQLFVTIQDIFLKNDFNENRKNEIKENSDRLNLQMANVREEIFPSSSTNREVLRAAFSEREPIKAISFQLFKTVFNVNESISIELHLSQTANGIYQNATVNYLVFDKRGNTVEQAVLPYDSSYALYKTNTVAKGAPGDYMLVVEAYDENGAEIYTGSDVFTINNPAEGHDLSINNYSLSRSSAEPGKHSVDLDVSITNSGNFDENAQLRLRVIGPNNVESYSDSQSLGLILKNTTKSFENILDWSVPSSAANGAYSLQVQVLNDVGDFTPIDNLQERILYVGEINYVTPEALVGKEMTVDWDPDLELSNFIGGRSGAGGFGWVRYSSGGYNYDIAISGYLGDRVNSETGIVVKRNGNVVYASDGIDEDVGEPIYIHGTPLVIFAWLAEGDQAGLVIAEEISNLGLKTRKATTIVNIPRQFEAVYSGISCNKKYTRVHQASSNSDDEWNFNIAFELNSDISTKEGDCSSAGRVVDISASQVESYEFVIEYPGSNPSGYSPSISGYDDIENYTLHFYTAELVVEPHNDIALSSTNVPNNAISGEIIRLTTNIAKQGTLTPSSIEVLWTITNETDYKFEYVTSGDIGLNDYQWDTNGLVEGNYQVAIKAVSQGDIDLDDISVNKTITLAAAPKTIVNRYVELSPNISSAKVFNSEYSAKKMSESLTLKEGENHLFEFTLNDSDGNCQIDGLSYLVQLDSDGEEIQLGKTPLLKDGGVCKFSANITIQKNTTNVRILGSLNRYDDGIFDQNIVVESNQSPTVVIEYVYSELEFNELTEVSLTANTEDPDNDGVISKFWQVIRPDGVVSITYDADVFNFTPQVAGSYKISLVATDALYKEGRSEEVLLIFNGNVDSDGDDVEDSVDNCPAIPNPGQENTDLADDGGDACDEDDDNDNIADADDAFPLIAIGDLLDFDLDGAPNTCDSVCLSLGMTADLDDDNDGFLDTNDAFPLNVAASVDSDGDGKPDYFNEGCNEQCIADSGLTLDNDNDQITIQGWRYPKGDLAATASDNNSYKTPTNEFTEVWTASQLSGIVYSASGDIDGDNQLELVVVSGGEIRMYDGDGTEAYPSISIPSNSDMRMLLDDVDGDGVNEILVGTRESSALQVNIYKNDGSLVANLSRTGGSDSNMWPVSYLGNHRLLVAYTTGYAREPRGYSVWDINTETETWYYDLGPCMGDISATDVDFDGDLDFIGSMFTCHNGASGSGVNGSGTRTTDGDLYSILVDETGEEQLVQILGDDTSGGANGGNIHVLADLESDGVYEIVASIAHNSSYPGDAQIRILNLDGTTKHQVSLGTNLNPRFLVSDLDSDGTKEIVVWSKVDRSLRIYDSELNEVTIQENVGGSAIYAFVAADIDGDGSKEILMRDDTVLKVFGGNDLQEKLSLDLNLRINNIWTSDLNNDLTAEIIVTTSDGVIHVLSGGAPNEIVTDTDNDSISDDIDNCPLIANSGQENTDLAEDGGDACDEDDDNDNIADVDDTFPLIAIGNLLDSDNDGAPNECDSDCLALGMTADADDDNDGIIDIDDPFPLNPNSVPASPVISSIEEEDGALVVSFSPNGDGGSNILDYTITCGDTSVTSSQSPIRIEELENDVSYACFVTARNVLGNSVASDIVSATPEGIIRSGLNIPLLKAILDAQSAPQ